MNLDNYEGHTPGPWKRNVNAQFPVYAGESPNFRYVAAALCHRLTEEEVEANLTLIAAAPELLEDNKRMRNLLMLIVETVGVDQDDYHELEWDWEDFEFFIPRVEKWYEDDHESFIKKAEDEPFLTVEDMKEVINEPREVGGFSPPKDTD